MTDHHFRTAISAVPDPVLHISGAGEVTICNEAAAELLGDWIVGRHYATVLRQPGLLGRIEEVQTRAMRAEAQMQMPDRSGELQYRVRITPLPAGETDTMHPVLLHISDITHLRAAEVMRRNFVANVSHELRTPLTALLGFIETLRGPARDDPQAQARFLAIMDEEARRMNRLVSDLLSLSRVEEQERMRPSDTVDLRGVLTGVIATLRPSAEDRDMTLALELAEPDTDDPYEVEGDRDQLTQVFVNLVENALKYGGKGNPVVLRLTREDRTPSLGGGTLRVDVMDRGEGISPHHLPRLTERFYRIDAHRSRALGGTGLGLAIVKHIVNRHRGRLRITSEIGEGSTFSVQLPAR